MRVGCARNWPEPQVTALRDVHGSDVRASDGAPRSYGCTGRLGCRPDAWWPDAGVAAEADSREWHLSPEDWDRTRTRHDRMCAAGIIPLHFSPRQIRREPAEVVRLIKDAIHNGLQRPSLPIRTVPCPTSTATQAAARQ